MTLKKGKNTIETKSKTSLKKKGEKVLISSKSNVEVVNSENELMDADLSKDFDLKSEKIEKDVMLKKLSKEEREQPEYTSVSVYKEDGIERIKPSDLKKFIKKSKGIKQIVIEKISIDESTRVAMKYVPKEEIEEDINNIKDFADQEIFNNENVLDDTDTDTDTVIEEDNNVKQLEAKSSFRLKDSRSNIKSNSFRKKHTDFNNENIISNTKVKNSNSTKELKKVSYEKHQLTKKNNLINEFFYKAKDHVELFKVGNSYMTDFEQGLKSFAYVSLEDDSSEDREKSIFGVTTFFSHHKDIKICIITASILESYYSVLVDQDVYNEEVIFETEKLKVFNADGFDLITFEELAFLAVNIGTFNLSHVVEHIVDKYDLLLWDLPTISHMDKNKQIFFPIIRCIDIVSIVVSENKTKIEDISSLIKYFKKYEIKVKGFLFSSSHKYEREAA